MPERQAPIFEIFRNGHIFLNFFIFLNIEMKKFHANVVLVTHSQGVLVGPRELNGPEVLQGQPKEVDVGLGGEEELLYTKKVTKCLLQTPATKAKEVESSMQKGRRSTRLANKPKSALSMEQQATTRL